MAHRRNIVTPALLEEEAARNKCRDCARLTTYLAQTNGKIVLLEERVRKLEQVAPLVQSKKRKGKSKREIEIIVKEKKAAIGNIVSEYRAACRAKLNAWHERSEPGLEVWATLPANSPIIQEGGTNCDETNFRSLGCSL